ncbi:hypothetical protein HRbin35_00330 [bacterium HR35]|nr:hypothetical protein HRbin35_00330 [bacterium HR35]
MPKSNEPVRFDDFEKRLREKEKEHLDLIHLLNDLNWLKNS